MSFNNPVINSFRGAFSLDEVHTREVNNDFPDRPDSAGSIGTYGYVGGNVKSPSSSTTVDRIDFSNDLVTATARGTVTGRNNLAATSNSIYGWWIGGGSPIKSLIERTTFTSDLNSAIARGSLPTTGRAYHSAVGNQNFGWIIGGFTSAGPATSVIDRFDYSTDNGTSIPRGTATVTGGDARAAVGTQSYGWIFNINISTSIGRIDYSNDEVSPSIRGSLSASRYRGAATGNGQYGWSIGGQVSPGGAAVSTIERVDYANDTALAKVRGPLAIGARAGLVGFGNANFGWAAGGGTPAPALYTYIERVDYSNDTSVTTLRGYMSSGQLVGHAGMSNYGIQTLPITYPPNSETQRGGFGWFVGGYLTQATATRTSAMHRIDFSNDLATSSSFGVLSTTRYQHGGVNNANYGWVTGGDPTGTVVDRMSYSTDTWLTQARAFLSNSRRFHGTSSNANYGWLSAGYVGPTWVTSVDRLDFSNDNSASASRGPVSAARYGLAGVGNVNYGWHISGTYLPFPATYTTMVDRIVYANDTAIATVRATIAQGILSMASSSNSDYGWFGGGYTGVAPAGSRSTIYRLDFSNDTTTSTRGPITTTAFWIRATGNANYGWFAGGWTPTLGSFTNVGRIDYANDSSTASARGYLSATNNYSASVSNYVKERQQPFIGGVTVGSYGWIYSGWTYLSSVERIDFSNDSTISSTRGTLSISKSNAGGLGNTDFSWAVSGSIAPAVVTTVDRITHSNDLATALVRGPLTIGKTGLRGSGTQQFGWLSFGNASGSITSWVDRIDYQNDTLIIKNRTNLNTTAIDASATGNTDYIWWAGRAYTSDVVRLTMANDLAGVTARGPLNISPGFALGASSGNQIYGWFYGGTANLPQLLSTVNRIDYANDTATSTTRGTLTAGRTQLAAVGNVSYGWVTGGADISNRLTTVERIDYSNDNVTATSRGNVVLARDFHGSSSNYVKTLPQTNVTQYNKGTTTVSTGNGSAGWFATGFAGSVISSIERMLFDNDTAVNLNRSNVATARTKATGISNSLYGWWAGGYQSSSVKYSIIDRLDFSNDSANTSVRANLFVERNYTAGLNNQSYGWFAGADGVTYIDRITFSNDLVKANARTFTLTGATGGRSGFSVSQFGWYGGGSGYSTVERLNFSSDTTLPLARGLLTNGRYNISSISSLNYGWFVGGFSGGNTSIVDRLDLATDTTNAVARNPFPFASNGISAVGTLSYGWFNSSTAATTIYRLDYSNDSTFSSRGLMTAARYTGSGTSNSTK